MAVVKDRFLNIFLWKIIGADGVGIIGWAQTWSQKPLRFIMDNVTKVTFPAYSRLQHDPQELKKAIEKTLFFISLITFPIVALLATLAPLAVKIIPRYSKWETALIPLALYCFNSALAAISTPLTNTLNAIGKVKINTYLMIMWTALAWLLTPALALKFGYLGVAYATAIIALSSVVPVIIVKRYVDFSLKDSFLKPAVATVIMLSVSIFISNLFINIVISVSTFAIAIYILTGKELVSDFRRFYNVLVKKT